MTTPASIVQLAQQIATSAHAGQFRRDGITPYIEHPESVAGRVGSDPDAQAVAWLHDVLEDSTYTGDMLLAAGIPDGIVDAVAMLTKTGECDYDDYLERIASSPLASKVKIADMLSNLADNPSYNQIRKYSKGLLRLTRDFQEDGHPL